MAVDVVVIGAGVIGQSVAWRLAETGRSVVIYDPHPSSGASYVAAGMLAPVTEAAYGEEQVTAITLRSAAAWPRFAADVQAASDLDPRYRQTGTLLVGADTSDHAHLEALYEFHRHLELPSRLVSASEARAIEPLLSTSTRGGIFASSDAQVDSRRLLGALSVAAASRGVVVRHEVVREIATTSGRVTGVRTDGGREVASVVVLAAGYRSIELEGILGGWSPPTRPVKGQILRLRRPKDRPALSATVRAIVAGFSVYVVPRADDSVVVGATQEDVGPDETVTAGGVYTLLRDALRTIPTLAEYELVESRAGLRPGSPDNVAMVGGVGVEGLLVATGHHRNGILLAPITTEVILELIEQRPLPEWATALRPDRFRASQPVAR